MLQGQSQQIRDDENGVDENHKYFDEDLAIIVPGNDHMFEGAVLEFDFIPKGDFMEFSYVFASDEYPKYVCTKFNDVFGFFLSGPGINGPFSNNGVNLALIPGTEIPVAINTVNSGEVVEGDQVDIDKYCNGGAGLENSEFFIENKDGQVLNDMLFNGFTKKFKAASAVQCGKTYHIKLAITDISDNHWNSGVFLESGSFNVITDSVADIVKLDVPICAPFEVIAQNGIDVPEEIWIWGDGSDEQTVKPGGQEVKHVYKEPGTYIIKLIGIDDESCIGRDTVEREITLEPEIPMEISSKQKFPDKCDTYDEYEFEIELETKNVKSSIWYLDGDEIARDVFKIKEKVKDEGQHEVTVELTSELCGRDTTLKWNINYRKPKTMQVSAGEPQEVACYPFEFEFWSKTKYADEIEWDFGDGKKSTKENPTHKYDKLGNYEVTFTAKNDTLCEPEKTITFDVSLIRDKSFDADFKIKSPEPCESTKYDLEVEVEYTGEATTKVKWDFDDNHVEVLEDEDIYDKVEHVYTKEGLYKIRLKAYDDVCGLDSVIYTEVLFKRKPNLEDIFAPNVFTPNGDKINDQFVMFYGENKNYNFYSDVYEYEVDIFNRWGTKVFSSGLIKLHEGHKAIHWEGSTPLLHGVKKQFAPAADGVFFYMIRYKMECLDEEENSEYRKLIGNVHLMK